jgi:nucleoside-diphosphate-sugar epimerase
VRNLCHAIELALDTEGAALDGRRLFVTDGEPVSWNDLVGELLALAGGGDVRHIARSELRHLLEKGGTARTPKLGASIRHLVSSDVRAALRKDPLLERFDLATRAFVAKLGTGIETRLRLGIEGPTPVSRPNPHANLTLGLCAQQLREVRHLNNRAEQLLGFRPAVDFRRSMADFRAWYRKMHGVDTPYWSLSRHLYEP